MSQVAQPSRSAIRPGVARHSRLKDSHQREGYEAETLIKALDQNCRFVGTSRRQLLFLPAPQTKTSRTPVRVVGRSSNSPPPELLTDRVDSLTKQVNGTQVLKRSTNGLKYSGTRSVRPRSAKPRSGQPNPTAICRRWWIKRVFWGQNADWSWGRPMTIRTVACVEHVGERVGE